MIRKILLVILVLFSLTWLSIAHFLKSKVSALIDNIDSDNISISYRDISMSGFPWKWKIDLLEPKITLINQNKIQEFVPEKVTIGFGLYSASIDLGNKVQYLEYEGANTASYFFTAEDDILQIDLEYNKFLLLLKKSDSQMQHIIKLTSEWPQVSCIQENDNKLLFKLSSVNIRFEKAQHEMGESYQIKLLGDFDAISPALKMQKAHLMLASSYIIANHLASPAKELDFDHKLDLSNFQFKIDDASIDIKGSLKLSRSSSPFGKFDVTMAHYHNLIDQVVPENFVFSPNLIKKVINKGNTIDLSKNDIGSANFKVIFSAQGINIGKFNLLQLQE